LIIEHDTVPSPLKIPAAMASYCIG
jgi:hypothetical protein